MESVTPPVTSPAWRCYATGKNPSSIGAYWWRQLDRDEQEFVGVDRVPLKSRCYWEYLDDDSAVVIGVPLNVPPRELNGFLVSGGPYADPENYTYPTDLSDRLEAKFDYQLHPRTDPASTDDPENQAIVDDLERMIHQRFDAVEWFLETEDPELLNLSLFYINHLQHMAWRSDGVKHLWEVIDERLGRILETNELDLVIHSDHGLHEIQRVFYVNAWLQRNGYLTVADDDEGTSTAKRLVDTGYDIADSLGVKDAIVNLLPGSVSERLQSVRSDRILDSTSFETRIDFSASSAVGLPHGVVYVLDDDQSVRDELQANLEGITDPETGRTLADDVVAAEDVFEEPIPEDAPDLYIRYADGFEVKDISGDDESRVFGSRQKFRADNHREGILLGYGPNMTDDDALDLPNLVDIAPTVMHLLGQPVPDDMDGSVVESLFAPGSDAATRPIETQQSVDFGEQATDHTTSDEMQDRLQDLGYLE